MSDVDIIYNLWVRQVTREYSSIAPDTSNENHVFELGKILNNLGLTPIEIDEMIENIKDQHRIIKITEERERKVPPGSILVKNKKSGYLYVILKSTYSDNPERYALPTQDEKTEWETGTEKPPPDEPEDDLVKTPKVAKAKIQADPYTAVDISLKGDVEDEEPQNAVQEPQDPVSAFKYGINRKHFMDDRLESDATFEAKRRKAKLELPDDLEPYRIPDQVISSALVPIFYAPLVERIINTYNKEQGAEISFYIDNFDIEGPLSEQLGQLFTVINLTLTDEIADYFMADLKSYIDYVNQYDNTNQTTYAKDSALMEEWIKISTKSRKKMLNFLSEKFDENFFVIAATTKDSKDVKALGVSSKTKSVAGDANIKINSNNKEHWLRMKIEKPDTGELFQTEKDGPNTTPEL